MQQDGAPPTGPPRERNWVGWGLALFILGACAWFLDMNQVWSIVSRVHPAAVVGLLILITLDRLLMAWKWALLLRVVGVRLPLGLITRFYYQGSLTGIFLPSSIGGDLLRATWVAHASGVKHGVFASLLMEKIVGLLSAVIWAIIGAVVLLCVHYDDLAWIWLLVGATSLSAVILLFLASLHASVHEFVLSGLGRFATLRAVGLLHRLYQAYAHFSSAKNALAANMVLTLTEHALQMAVFLLVARNLGIEVDAILFFAMTGVQFLVFRIPISPDGWGIGELSAIGLFGLIGVSAEAAFTMMFVNHILTTVACLPGLWFLLWGKRSPAPVA